MSQQRQVLQMLKKNKKGVTAMDAFKVGITRLAARVHDLRNSGHMIVTHIERNKNANYARYVLRV